MADLPRNTMYAIEGFVRDALPIAERLAAMAEALPAKEVSEWAEANGVGDKEEWWQRHLCLRAKLLNICEPKGSARGRKLSSKPTGANIAA